MKKSVICEICKSSFERDSREITRSLRLGRKQYCSRSCAGKVSCKHLSMYTYNVSQHCSNKKDEFSLFRDHLRRARRREQEFRLELSDLKEVWDNQNGLCVYSGISLRHPHYKGSNDVMTTASLDRIDSSKGYVKGNVQFISMAINYMKSTMTHDQTMDLCKTIALHHK